MKIPKHKKILLGVTGSIALYKSLELIRRLKDLGCSKVNIGTPKENQIQIFICGRIIVHFKKVCGDFLVKIFLEL